jgi:UDP-2,3-diacylglucosamine pyrophosphatase LpxH
MMGHPEWLESFIDSLAARATSDEVLELVIAGDFVDFLAIPPYADFTPNPKEAVEKLKTVTKSESPFARIFDALGRHVRDHRLAVLVGNHDVELGLPAVQEAVLDRIDATSHDVLFVDDGRAYRVGRALIEHGNAYDGANANDWDTLRHIGSAQSRDMAPIKELDVSLGSVSTPEQKYINRPE